MKDFAWISMPNNYLIIEADIMFEIYFVVESVSFFFPFLFVLLSLSAFSLWFLVLVCPEREHATPQPRIGKPTNTSAEEFLNRQAEVFKNSFVKDVV